MASRLPQPGSDDGTWGNILNDFLMQTHNADGTLKDNSVTGRSVMDGGITDVKISGSAGIVKSKLSAGVQSSLTNADTAYQLPVNGIPETDLASAVRAKLNATAPVTSVAGKTGDVTLAKTDVGLGSVTNDAQLKAASNLSDLASVTTARTNLGLGTIAVLAAPTGAVVGTSDTQTLTNKTVRTRVGSTATSPTPAVNIDSYDIFKITALAENITSMSAGLTGTAYDGQKLLWYFKDNGSVRTISWGTSFANSGSATLLATTAAGKQHVVGTIYDAAAGKHVCMAVDAVGY